MEAVNDSNKNSAGRTGSGSGPGAKRPPAAVEKLSLLARPVTAVKGVGGAMSDRLAPLGVKTVGDLLYHMPRRYLDRSAITSIAGVKVGEEATVMGRVCDVESRITRTRKKILTITVFDGTGYLSGIWFNQEYHRQNLEEGALVTFSGKVRFEYNRLHVINPAYDVLEHPGAGSASEAVHTGRIIPLYPASAGLTSAQIRRIVSRALDAVEGIADPVPAVVREKFDLMPLGEALHEIHFPSDEEALRKARFRALFDEIFIMQVGLALVKKHRESQGDGIIHRPPGPLVARFREGTPFELTTAQERAWREIASDMGRPVRMNRLLQGEVGSGKTVVAVMALLTTVENGYQGAIMAPTEVLARQHYERISGMLEGVPVSVELLTGNSPPGLADQIRRGEVDLVVGTHALIQQGVDFARLGLVVVDEQHRFGLAQRSTLAAKGSMPDVLHMSATPIPRTLSLTLYGDLDVSVIDELPAGRKGVVTVVADEGQRRGAFAMVRKEIEKGRQAFVICPLIEESDGLQARAAGEEAKRLSDEFPDCRIGLLHGQLKSEEKRRVMRLFEDGQIDILISTLVVEVGVDIPNATVMIVENADRFGLAQLHQLRGRIGRGDERGICVLFANPSTDEARARLEAIRKNDDGFSLAEADLEIRGEGTVFGTRQSGLPDLKLARLTRDFELIRRARAEAFALVEKDPGLSRRENVLLRWETKRRFGASLVWLFHG